MSSAGLPAISRSLSRPSLARKYVSVCSSTPTAWAPSSIAARRAAAASIGIEFPQLLLEQLLAALGRCGEPVPNGVGLTGVEHPQQLVEPVAEARGARDEVVTVVHEDVPPQPSVAPGDPRRIEKPL